MPAHPEAQYSSGIFRLKIPAKTLRVPANFLYIFIYVLLRSSAVAAVAQSVSQPLAGRAPRAAVRKLRLLPLVAATYFMVSGGPYGLEDIIGQAGYLRGLLLLALVPIIWSFPTALMIGELASAMPEEGGFYVWVGRALGPFWGFQEAWLSLAASVFDMAIYPALFVAYLAQFAPALTAGHRGVFWSLAVIVACVAWNLRGAYSVGQGSIWMFALLLTPFAGILVFGLWHLPINPFSHPLGPLNFSTPADGSMTTALLVVLWNLMGWDNASTVAREVENPQKNYIRAMIASVALVTVSYVTPIAVVAFTGIAPGSFATGAWVDAANALAGGHWLGYAVVAGGAITGIAMFNALMLSYARVPAAMAQDGLLPKVLTSRMKNGVPWASVLVCALGWALCSGFSFERLIELDVMLYGMSLILEFVALVALRLREPEMQRPFRVPGGLPAVIALGVGPTVLIFFALYAARDEHVARLPALTFGLIVVLAGLLVYGLMQMMGSARRRQAMAESTAPAATQ
ncbi:MAG: APC family permease [Acidobacteriaceae bacterium]